ncbi:hypothetical protein C8R48DRAFT_729184 [Suillus tomentosus]|nr:hypothetical protein C8R48DRAFT_729184 [Suillus tomentosus]
MTCNLANIHVPELTGKVVTTDNCASGSGNGNFADVRKGIYTQQGHSNTVAVKILRPSLLSDMRLVRKTIRAKAWSTLNHPNVAGFIGVCYQDIGGCGTPK